MKWIFKNGDYFQWENNLQVAVVTIEQKRNFSGKSGEDVLLLDKTKSDWAFTAHFRIESVEVKDYESEYKTITIILNLVQPFTEERLLTDYLYSLRRITNYTNPLKHFRGKYSRLYDAEFEAIVNGKIYLSRTILGTVLNAMHSDHQQAFLRYVATEAPGNLAGKTDIDLALRLLLQYLNFAILKPAKYLWESVEILQSLVSDEKISEVGFAADPDKAHPHNTQMIKVQVNLIKEHLPAISGFHNDSRRDQILDFISNRRFQSLFKNAPLPITLK